jgi:hypothetical protein
MIMRSRATDRRSASECQGKRPDQAVKHRSDGRKCREPSTLSHLGFQPVQKPPTIHVSSGFIWGIPGESAVVARKGMAMANDNGPDSLVLRHMRDLSEKLHCLTSRVAGLEKVLPTLAEHVKGLNARVDRVELHLQRTYRRLGPIEPSP